MNLPIRWGTVTELASGRRVIVAELVYKHRQYRTMNIPPTGAATTALWLIIAAMTAEFRNSTK